MAAISHPTRPLTQELKNDVGTIKMKRKMMSTILNSFVELQKHHSQLACHNFYLFPVSGRQVNERLWGTSIRQTKSRNGHKNVLFLIPRVSHRQEPEMTNSSGHAHEGDHPSPLSTSRRAKYQSNFRSWSYRIWLLGSNARSLNHPAISPRVKRPHPPLSIANDSSWSLAIPCARTKDWTASIHLP